MRHQAECPGLITLVGNSPPVHADAKLWMEAAKLFNNEAAEITNKHSDRLLGAALLPTTKPEGMVAELERAVRNSSFVGGFFVVGSTVKPQSHEDYEPLYQKAVELDVSLWIHPSRPPLYPDYVGEDISQYQVWQTLSWLLESSTAMVRLVFNGVYERYPDLKLIIYHHGAPIPLFAQRMHKCMSTHTCCTAVRKEGIDDYRLLNSSMRSARQFLHCV